MERLWKNIIQRFYVLARLISSRLSDLNILIKYAVNGSDDGLLCTKPLLSSTLASKCSHFHKEKWQNGFEIFQWKMENDSYFVLAMTWPANVFILAHIAEQISVIIVKIMIQALSLSQTLNRVTLQEITWATQTFVWPPVFKMATMGQSNWT